jgi:hypothetical protein
MNDKEETKLLDVQIITTCLYIGSLILSIYITYNDKLSIEKDKGFLSDKKVAGYSIVNRIIVVALTAIFLYISYENKKNIEKKGGDSNAASLQLFASELTFISTLIVLYVVIKTQGERYSIISGSGNPNL